MGLEVRMLGPFEVLLDGTPVSLPPSRKTRALLAFLALADRPQRRERLCEIFWDVPDDPKGALRWSLSKIRRLLGEAEAVRLRADRAGVAFDRSGASIDAARLLGLGAGGLDGISTDELEALAGAFRGGFIDDLHLHRCPEFEAWRTAVAFEVETARGRLLSTLVARLADDPERALPHAERLAADAPDDPEAARRVTALREAVRRSVAAAPARAGRLPAETPLAGAADPAGASGGDEEFPAPPPVRHAIARDGTRIVWTATGEGPPLVRAAHWMSHLGFDHVSPVWRHWVRELSAISTFVRYDERCNGLSDWDVEDLSLDAFVGDLESVVDAAGVDRFALLGVSQSCAMAVRYAIRHPERVRCLILYGGYVQGWRARGDPEEIARREAILVLMRQGWGQENPFFGELFASMFVPGASREQIARFSELQRRTVSPRNALRLQNAFAEIDITADLPLVTVPTLVVHATGDRVAPISSGRVYAEKIPGARLVELESGNHILLEDEPAFGQFMDQVRDFLAETERGEVTAASARRGDSSMTRRRVTILDAEIVSPLAVLDDDAAGGHQPELASVVEEMRTSVEEHGGTVVEVGQGSLSAAFGAESPSEVHAVEACRAALALRSLVEKRTDGSARLRVGIDSGDAVVRQGPHASMVAGSIPRRARLLTQSLRGAVIALSDEAAAAAGGYVSFSAIRPLDISAGRRGRRIFQLKEMRSALSRWHLRAEHRLTAFTGRAAEMELMMRCLDLALESQGRVIFISGEPGIGKSRLAHEFLSRCPAHGVATAEAGALEFDRNVPFALLRRLLGSLLALDPAADPATLAAEVRASLAAIGGDGLDSAVLFALDLPGPDSGWTSMPRAERAHRVREALRRIVALRARERPLALVIEDLHWCDEASLAAIARLVEGVERLPVLVVTTARPEFRADWVQRSSVKPVNLDYLGPEDAHKLIRRLVGRHPSVGSLRRLLLERTDGTPLMIEETVGALVQSGRLTGKPGGYVARQPIVEVEPVTSVTPVIAARIARLRPGERHLLQVASVIGRDGPLSLLSGLSGLKAAEFGEALRAVERGEFLYELLGGTEAVFTFKHALVRDAAYASIPDVERRELHGRAFAAVSAIPEPAREALAEQLAHHAYVAGLWDAAATWLMRAAERAIERNAYVRAYAGLERAIGVLDALDATPEHLAAGIDARVTMQLACAALGDFEAGIARITEACEMAEAAGDRERLAHALVKLAYNLGNAGRLEEGLAAAERLATHAVANGLDYYACEADMAAAFILLLQGDARAAMRRLALHAHRFEGALRHERFGLLVTRLVWLQGCTAMAAALGGDFGTADQALAEARAVARETGRPQDIHSLLQFALQVDILRGPTDALLAEVETVLAETLDEWLFPSGPWLLTGLGEALMVRGRLDAAEAVLERAWEAADLGGMRVFAAIARRLLAVAQALGGDAEALAEVSESFRDDRDMPTWLRARLRRMLAAAAPEEGERGEEAMAWLHAAADQAEAAGLLPDAALCLEDLAKRLGSTNRAGAVRVRRQARAIRARMQGLVPA